MKQNKFSVEEMESRLEMGSWHAHEPEKMVLHTHSH
jgi:hypothetical protein